MRLLTLAACAALAAGCVSTARFVEPRPDGGVVVIPANTNHWPNYYRDEAARVMREKCPNGYEVTEERRAEKGEYRIEFRSTVRVPEGVPPPPPERPAPPGLPSRPVPID